MDLTKLTIEQLTKKLEYYRHQNNFTSYSMVKKIEFELRFRAFFGGSGLITGN